MLRERLRVARYVLAENPVNMLAFVLFGLIVLAACIGPALAPH
ncbi:hypothetical protein, partial [Klebsiella aerogenes]